jgi:hypothetical protein
VLRLDPGEDGERPILESGCFEMFDICLDVKGSDVFGTLFRAARFLAHNSVHYYDARVISMYKCKLYDHTNHDSLR